MNVIDIRNKKLAASLIEKLKRRHYEAYYCHDIEEMKLLIKKIIPERSSISWGGSASIRESGVTKMLKEGNYQVFDRDDAETPDEKRAIYLKAFSCDYYLSSVNAISEDGVIVNIDGEGNRTAAITWGPKHVIFVVGMNKVCQDTEAAIKRARSTAAPTNMARFNLDTPCAKDGCCHDCKSPECICNYFSIMRNSHPAKRHTVILVNEQLGY